MFINFIGTKKLVAAALSVLVASNQAWLEQANAFHSYWEQCAGVPLACDDTTCGNCKDERLDEVGCNCPECECAVCYNDPWCCDNSWDFDCVNLAKYFCTCEKESQGPSESPAPTVAPSISQRPSASHQPTKESCDEQDSNVGICSETDCGNCKEVRSEAGCSCHECECIVCLVDSFCCLFAWDAQCVNVANDVCKCPSFPSASPAPSISLVPSGEPSVSAEPSISCDGFDEVPAKCDAESCGDCSEPRDNINDVGCSCGACQCVVCQADSYCCDIHWDHICADRAIEYCDCSIPSPRSSPVPSFSLAPAVAPSGGKN
ncbi:hypothetical protein ACA910_010101 [Epithemia clementina (nom. ined.)]